MSEPEPIVDAAVLLDTFDGDRDLLDELAGIFIEQAPDWIAQLRAAVDSGDAEATFRVAHQVNGSVSCFRVAAVRQAAAALEALGRAGSLAGAGEALDRLEAGLLELSAFLGDAPWRR